MNILQTGEAIENGLELVTEGLLSELDLTSVRSLCSEIFSQRSCFIDNPDKFFFSLLWMKVATLNTATGI